MFVFIFEILYYHNYIVVFEVHIYYNKGADDYKTPQQTTYYVHV